MPVFVSSFFEPRVQGLFEVAHVIDEAFSKAGVEYCVVGGLATYLYVEEALPDAGRLTRDIDIAVRREDLARIQAAVSPYGLTCRHTAELDMLVYAEGPSARRAVHLLVRMKLTSFHIKDKMRLKDLHEAGLIPSEIEAAMPPLLRERLRQVMRSE